MRGSAEPVTIAILAKAPLPGYAKTRLAPALGLDGAAELQARLIARAAATARAAALGPVTLWTAPDPAHPLFAALAAEHALVLARQPDGDLGGRMLAAVTAANGATLVIGTDCPALTPEHLRDAAAALRDGMDAALVPAQDGGYVLIGLRRPQPALFVDMTWSVPGVAAETRRRMSACGLTCRELPPLWDLDLPEDLERLHAAGLDELTAGLQSAPIGSRSAWPGMSER